MLIVICAGGGGLGGGFLLGDVPAQPASTRISSTAKQPNARLMKCLRSRPGRAGAVMRKFLPTMIRRDAPANNWTKVQVMATGAAGEERTRKSYGALIVRGARSLFRRECPRACKTGDLRRSSRKRNACLEPAPRRFTVGAVFPPDETVGVSAPASQCFLRPFLLRRFYAQPS
jgi:hypothetical protein